MKLQLACVILFLISLSVKAQIYKNPKAPVESRVKNLAAKMTTEEKMDYINGINWMYTKPIERLGIPSFRMSDGPVGTKSYGKSTAYPTSMLAAATWDTTLLHRFGVALGKDARARGVNFLLGPGVNITRTPMAGRSFEYLGEDPFLSATLVTSYIEGVQSQGVVATVKHFIANNEEYDRDNISSDIDERTLNEIYLPAFKAAVLKAKVGAVMNSYNLLNGVHTSQSNYLNNKILKNKWGFDGVLMSDWGGVHNGIAAFKGGTDLEMPGNQQMTPQVILPALASGQISTKTLDDKVSRILRVAIRFGFFDRPQTIASIPKDNPENAKVALDIAEGGIVLLKNENHTLPINTSKVRKVAFIGPNADTFNAGGGSSLTDPFHFVSAFEGLKKEAKDMQVTYTMGIPNLSYLASKSVFYTGTDLMETGLTAEYFNNKDLSGTPKVTKVEKTVNHSWVQTPDVEGIGQDNFSARWTGVIRAEETAKYKFTVNGDDGYRLFVNDKNVIDYWSDHGLEEKSTLIQMEKGKTYSIRLEYYESVGDAGISLAYFLPKDENYNDAVNAAKEADIVILCVGFNQQTEHEGTDRPFELPAVQDSLIKLVANTNPNTIVVLNAGGNVAMTDWLPQVKGLLHVFYPGQEGGTAIANILLGKVNPSGKLPLSFEKKWADNPTFNYYYDTDNDKHVAYKEGLLVGYRYYDTKKVVPLFPFGFGLSYTSFAYSNLKVDLNQSSNKIRCKVSFDVKNTGDFDGAEVAEVYVTDIKSPVLRPLKELKGFSKVFLKKGEVKTIAIDLDDQAFSYYKEDLKRFGFDKGDFDILIGSSSRAIKLNQKINIK